MAQANGRDLLDIVNENVEFLIPIYQRSYDWDRNNIAKLLGDLESFAQRNKNGDEKYFLGNMIFKRHEDSIGIKYSVVDGQQRLTTLVIILLSIYKKFPNDEELMKIKDYFINSTNGKFKLSISRIKDGNVLEAIYNDHLTAVEKETSIYKNYKFVSKRLQTRDDAIRVFQNLRKTLVVFVMLSSNDEEHVIFENVNSTGKPLKDFDLIKNLLFSREHAFEKYQQNTLVKKFDNISEMIGKKYHDDFFRHFICLNDHSRELVNKSGRKIYNGFKKAIDLNNWDYKSYDGVENILSRLKEVADVWNYIQNKKFDDSKLTLMQKFLIDNIKTYFVAFVDATDLFGKEKMDKLLLLFGSLILKRNLKGLPDKNITRDAPKMIKHFIEDYNENNKDLTLQNFKLWIENEWGQERNYKAPNLHNVLSTIKEYQIYSTNKNKALSILCAYEVSKLSNNLPTILDNKVSIEHVLPVQWDLWTNDLESSGPITQERKDEIETKKHTIGNLTILTNKLNSQLSNNIFNKKKGKIFADTLKINRDFDGFEIWNENEIDKRSIKMVEHLFSFLNNINKEDFVVPEELLISFNTREYTRALNSKNASYVVKEIWENKDIEENIKNKKSNKVKEKVEIDRNMNFNIGAVVMKGNVLDHIIQSNEEIFTFIPYRDNISRAYNKISIEIYNKESTKIILYKYLYEGIGHMIIDSEMTENKRMNGYISAATLAFMRIQTNGEGKGCLSKLDSAKAKNLINQFVDKCY